MTELSTEDYKNILEYYKSPVPKSKQLLKKRAEKLLVSKLCRCIKKVDKGNEWRAIGICTKSVINKKGYSRGTFTCKKQQNISLKKNTTRRIKK